MSRLWFIQSSVEIRETFDFALPEQILKAVKTYSLHLYDGMLWDFSSDSTGQFCRAWNTCVKLAHRVPRRTKTFIVEHYLAEGFDPVMKELYCRYVNFLKNLRTSSSYEVKYLFEIVSNDIQSNTGRNIYKIQRETGINPCKVNSSSLRNIPMKTEIPEQDEWRIPLVDKLLNKRAVLESNMEDTDEVENLINGICST